MKGLMILADGFEDTEALTTRDVLMRAGIGVTTCSITDRLEVESSFGVHVLADALLKLVFDCEPFDFIILPGGGRGTHNLSECQFLKQYLDYFVEKNKLVCAICAAPSILGKYGYLENRKYTCFAGFNAGIRGDFTGNEVEKDGNIITARSMHYSIPFALKIIETLLGENTKEKVLVGLNGLTAK
ncbi:MAG: DJ-1/PfpI family protein [Firmicutes bacterium]|nr:DJ-1/PfpI family protein [Candidatus Fiminaster equi]